MTYKIGLISDTHATVAPLKQALQLFTELGVDKIICAGDIAGYGDDQLADTIELLTQYTCEMISGNHDAIEELGDQPDTIIDFFNRLPRKLEYEIEGKRIYVAHAEPPDLQHGGIKLLNPEGEPYADRIADWQQRLKNFHYDILIVGHTHQVFAQQINNILVINPGSSKYNHSCMILELPSMKIDTYALSGKSIIYTWNWGKFYQEQQNK